MSLGLISSFQLASAADKKSREPASEDSAIRSTLLECTEVVIPEDSKEGTGPWGIDVTKGRVVFSSFTGVHTATVKVVANSGMFGRCPRQITINEFIYSASVIGSNHCVYSSLQNSRFKGDFSLPADIYCAYK